MFLMDKDVCNLIWEFYTRLRLQAISIIMIINILQDENIYEEFYRKTT